MIRPGTRLDRLQGVVEQMHVAEADLFSPADVEAVVGSVRPDACLHLAWSTSAGYLDAQVNERLLCAGLQLAQALEQHECRRLIAAGTCFEYDTEAGFLTEATSLAPKTLYAATKHALHSVLEALHAQGRLQVSWLRLFYLHGPFEHPARLVPAVARALLQGIPAPLTQGDQVRDFLHVDDVAAAFWEVLRSGITGPLNVGSGHPVSVRQLAETLGAIAGRPELLEFGRLTARPGDPPFICADNRRLRSTGWTPRFDTISGLRDTVDWWRSRLSIAG